MGILVWVVASPSPPTTPYKVVVSTHAMGPRDVCNFCTLCQEKSTRFSQPKGSSMHCPLSHTRGELADVLGTGTCNAKDFMKWEGFIRYRHEAPHRQGVTVRQISHLVLGRIPSWRALWCLTGIDHPYRLRALLWAAGLCCWCQPAITKQLLNDRNYQSQDKIQCPHTPSVTQMIKSSFLLLKDTLKTS